MLQLNPARSRVPARFVFALVPLLFSFSSYSQTSAAPAGAAKPESAAINPTEVTVEVTAHDKKGGTVSDLTAADVQMVDGGVPVTLKSLRLAGETEETVMFLFDQVVSGVAKTDRDLANVFLTSVAGHNYRFVVFKIEKRLHLLQAPTTNIDAVKAAIEAATVAKRPDYLKVTEAAEKQMTEDIDSAAGARQATAKALLAMLMDSQKLAETDAKQTPTTAALLAASRGQKGVPGRKAILYFSQGLDWDKSSPETLRDIMQAANRTRASLYSFDAEIGDTSAAQSLMAGAAVASSQLMGNVASGSATSTATSGASAEGGGTGAQANEYAGRLQSGEGAVNSPKSLAGICVATGGLHVAAADGKRAANEIAMNLNSYYLASWISPSSGDDSKLRPLSVKTLRKGVVLGTRAGYYPLRGSAVEKVSGSETKLLAALAAPDLPAALPINAALLRYGNAPDNDVNSVLVQVPVDQVAMNGDQGSVSVLIQLKDQSGAVVRKFSEDVLPRRTVAGAAQAAPDVISFRRQFTAPPGEYVLESVAMDATGGKIGAQRSNVVIPAVATGLALGDVLLVRRIDPAGADETADPLRCAKGIVVPNLSGHIAKTGGAKIDLFFAIHTDPGSTDAPILSAELRHDDELVGKLPLKLSADPERKTFPYLTTLSANTLGAGEYEMTVILSQGGQKVTRTVTFTLE
jgi:VWFA-related protein